jgi:Ribonuclease G/E
VAPGARVLVQVAAWAEPGKAPPVADRVRLKGRLAILTPGAAGLNLARSIAAGLARTTLDRAAAAAMAGAPDDLGLIVRSLAVDADPAALADEVAALRATWDRITSAAGAGPARQLLPAPGAADLARRDWPLRAGEPIEEHAEALAQAGDWEAAAELLRPGAGLAAGRLWIEPTRALVAVDVDSGDGGTAAALQANLAAARELPRQLRLRGLGGQISVDFAPLSKVDRPRVEAALRAALRGDGVETTLAGWTPLGHLELLRKRARRPLAELPLR